MYCPYIFFRFGRSKDDAKLPPLRRKERRFCHAVTGVQVSENQSISGVLNLARGDTGND